MHPFTCPYGGGRNDSCACVTESDGTTGRTHFDRIRVDLHNMRVNVLDTTFTQQAYGMAVIYASAGDCYSAVDCAQGAFSVDLAGTGVRVADTVQWQTNGHRSHMHITRSDDYTLITGRCGGYCGHCFPSAATGLRLQIDSPRVAGPKR